MTRVGGDGQGSIAIARALMTLVERLEHAESVAIGDVERDAAIVAIRDAIRALTARVRDGALLMRVTDDGLVLDGAPPGGEERSDPALVALVGRLRGGGVGTLTVRDGAAPGELLTLARWIARAALGATPGRGITVAGETPGSSPAAPAAPVRPGASRELLRTWSVLVMPVVPVVHVPPAEPDATGGPSGSAIGEAVVRLTSARTDAAALQATRALSEAIAWAESREDARAIGLVARGAAAALRTAGGGGGRLAVEALVRRLLSPKSLPLLVRWLPVSADPAALAPLLARAGDAGVALLVEALLQADDAAARRVYFDAIVATDVGALLLFESLADPRWYVVRNAAALLGEMHFERADRRLLPLLEHDDERIRIAAARALMRLRTPVALTGLQRRIDDTNAEVRRLAAASYGVAGAPGSATRPSVGPLAAAFERETDDDVALEMLAALGKLGSSDAVQRLLRIALPPTGEGASERGRPSWLRIAALEALVRARGHAVIPAIEGLVNDPDAEVAGEARRVLGRDG